MKIAVVGTGALGGWYAGLLARAGQEVHCLARRDHEIITRDGLLLRTKAGETRVKVTSASADGLPFGPCDLVVVTAKSTANDVLPGLISPLLAPHTIVLTLQNGMGNVEALSRLVAVDRIVAGLCFVCINRTAPAVIETTLAGYVRMAAAQGGINASVDVCVNLFRQAGVEVLAEASLEAVLWKKLCWNIPFNGLSIGAGGITTDLILADPALKERALRLMKEVQSAAVARGFGFGDEHIRKQFEVTDGMGPYRPSSLIDFQEGREVEVEGI
jgi:2-dehydropantoate 2-reductase